MYGAYVVRQEAQELAQYGVIGFGIAGAGQDHFAARVGDVMDLVALAQAQGVPYSFQNRFLVPIGQRGFGFMGVELVCCRDSCHLATGMENSAPAAMVCGQRCMIDFCLV